MRNDPNNSGYLQHQDDEPAPPPTELERLQARELAECHDLLFELVESDRPVPGGFQAKAWDLLTKHGAVGPGDRKEPPQ